MSFNSARRNKNRNINSNNNANNNYGSKLDKQNRLKNDKGQNLNKYDGVYSNPDFMYANTSLIGTLANIVHKDGNIYEGVFNTFSSEFEIVLNTVSKVIPKAENTNSISPNVGSLLASLSAKNEFIETVIFKLSDIVMMTIPNVNLEFAIKGNFTDTEISKFNPNSLLKEKDLVPWDGGCNDEDDSQGNELCLTENDCNSGWNADDMFKLNEKKYNLSTTYTESMEGYTVSLDKNTEDYAKREAEANRIAQLIESDVTSKDRLAKEDGDEEDKFSAVHRPINDNQQTSNVNKTTNYQSNNSSTTSINQQQSHSRHDNNLNNNMINRNRNKNQNQNTPVNLNNNNYSNNNNQNLNRSKNQQSSMQMGNNLQQQSNYHHFSRSNNNNGPIHNRNINNSRLDSSHNHDNLIDKDQHHRIDNRDNRQLIHNEPQITSQQGQSLPQRNSHNNNSNNQRRSNINTPTLQKREETTHDLKKFSSGFKLASNQQQLENKENVKEINKDIRQLNLNKGDSKEHQINKNETSKSSLNKSLNKDEDNQVNKPLIDKLPKDKSPPRDKLNNNDQSTDKVHKQFKQQETTSSTSKSVESQQQINEQQSTSSNDNKAVEDNSNSNNESMKSSNSEGANSISQVTDSTKGATNTSSNDADKTLIKSTLNPNAKEFKFNPNAKEFVHSSYTPKFVPPTSAYQPPSNPQLAGANLQPIPNVNPQLAFQPHLPPHSIQPAALHPSQTAQIPINQLGVQQHSNQQQGLIGPGGVLHHPNQQHQTALMNHAAVQLAHQGHHPQMIVNTAAFSHHPNLIPAASNVPHQFGNAIQHHHPHPHQQYLIPAVASPVSTANLPYGQPVPNQNAILNQPPPQQNMNQQTSNPIVSVSNTSTNNQSNNPRSNRNKTNQYHNQSNTNQRTNQTPSNVNPTANLNQSPNVNQQQVRGEYVVTTTNPVYPQQIHLNNFNPYQMPNQQMNNVQFNPHHHTRMITPQINMVPGMTAYTTAPDPATIQQIYSMTNMQGVPQFVAVSNSAPSVSSPVHMIPQTGVLQPAVSTPNNIQQTPNQHRPTSTSSNSGSNNTSQQQVLITNQQQSGAVQYATMAPPSFIIASPNLPHAHLNNNNNQQANIQTSTNETQSSSTVQQPPSSNTTNVNYD